MGKITRNSAKKNEELISLVSENSESESEYNTTSEEGEEESSMDETSGDEDFINVSTVSYTHLTLPTILLV